jgi:DNA-binding NarL/FixJ family response regulator
LNRKYVYTHVHPETNEVFYVGLGSNDRAWAITSKSRHPDHRAYLLDLVEEGYVASDWTIIVERNLDNNSAFELERRLIVEHQPFFNKDKGQNQMTSDLKEKAVSMRLKGQSWIEISRELGYHYTTIKHHVRKRLDAS